MDRLRIENISKRFPGVRALTNVSFSIAPGEIHALCGENGAGKSTLMNILTGNIRADEGRIWLNDEELVLSSPQEAFDRGISIVHQHLSLIDSISAAENIFLNHQPVNRNGLIDYRGLRSQAANLLDELGIEIDPAILVMHLSPAEKQMIEIAKALARNPQLLILDEPSASLTDKETRVLFRILDDLVRKDVAIIYISHRLAEIGQIATRISILKDGVYQGTYLQGELTRDNLISKMIGRELIRTHRAAREEREVLLDVEGISSRSFRRISFQVRRGEIVGLAGLVGAGRTAIAKAIFGAIPYDGKILFKGEKLRVKHPADAIRNGIAYVPEERKRLGLFSDMSVKENILAASANTTAESRLYDEANGLAQSKDMIRKFRVATTGPEQKVSRLSGGNQQKVVLGKWLLTEPDLLIVDEPTHGIDIGAKAEIYDTLFQLADTGKGIIVISSELPELLAICTRILVMRSGELAGSIPGPEATEEKIMTLAT